MCGDSKVSEWFKEGGALLSSVLKGFEAKLGMNVSEALTLVSSCLRVSALKLV